MAESTIDRQVLADLVRLACRAPSVHNSQPWQLVFSDGVLRLFLESHRVPHSTDLSGREAVISCGALLDHLRVAAAAADRTSEISSGARSPPIRWSPTARAGSALPPKLPMSRQNVRRG